MKEFFKIFVFAASAAGLMSAAQADSSKYSAKLTATPSPTGAGLVYVGTEAPSDAESVTYSTSDNESIEKTSANTSVTFGVAARPKFGYKFTGWTNTGSETPTFASAASLVTTVSGTTSSSKNGTRDYTVQANFAAVTPVPIIQCVGDVMTIHFYNANGSKWRVSVDMDDGMGEQLITSTDPRVFDCGTITRSIASSASANHFSLRLWATGASTGRTPKLSVMDDNGNSYYYLLTPSPVRACCMKEDGIFFDPPSVSSNTWSTPVSSDTSILEYVRWNANEGVHVRGVSTGTATLTASNYNSSQTATGVMGAECSFAVTVYDPLDVTLCEGDYVQGGFRSAVDRNWSFYLNGTRYEIPSGANEAIASNDFVKVRLESVNSSKDATLQIWANAAMASSEDTAHVALTDGVNYYGMHVNVDPERVLYTGSMGAANVASFADTTWRKAYIGDAESYVTAAYDESRVTERVLTVALMGLAPTECCYVQVYDTEFSEGNGANGIGYVLKMRVEGPKLIPVIMCQGGNIDCLEGVKGADANTQYTLDIQPSGLGVTASVTAQGSGALTHIESTKDAQLVSTVPVRVSVLSESGGKTVTNVTYAVAVYPARTMSVGEKAPGCLYGSTEPWIIWTSDPESLVAESVKYKDLESASMEAKKSGEYYVWATNSLAATYYAVRAVVHDVQNLSFCMEKNMTTNLVLSTDGEGVWSAATVSGSGVASVSLDNTTVAASNVTATITAGAADGTAVFSVGNIYREINISVLVTDAGQSGKRFVWDPTLTTTVYLPDVGDSGYAQILPDFGFDGDWTAYSDDASIVELTTSDGGSGGTTGNADSRVWVMPKGVGETRIHVATATTMYIYNVKVLNQPYTRAKETIGVGETIVIHSITEERAVSVSSDDNMIAQVMLTSDYEFTLTGVQDGETVIRVTTTLGNVYIVPVVVHERLIVKKIHLVIGANTRSTYTYKFDEVIAITNNSSGYVTHQLSGHTVTLIPVAPGDGVVDVVCKVDDLNQSTTLRYIISITRLADNDLEVLNYDDGYIVYKGADVSEIDGQLSLVFTNINEAGYFQVPDELTAKMDILAVGGGGGGGAAAGFGKGGGGGGAGGFAYSAGRKFTKGEFSVIVGMGGLSLFDGIAGRAEAGMNGGDSVITNAFGYALALANGGGGGGGPGTATEFTGYDGGSGGGGAYSAARVAGRGGRGTDGQGMSGGTPATLNFGGGGGGAGGVGSPDGTGGAGRQSDISGTLTTYSRGGAGGRADSEAAAASGSGYGDGGAGGNGGIGGNGADGIVIVRMTELYRNIQVPVPTTNDLVTARFLWEDGVSCKPFDYYGRQFRSPTDNHPYNWEDVIDHVEGTTNIVCELGGEGGTNKVGVGYYNFTVYLKDGYSWVSSDDSAYGSIQGMNYHWVLTEDLSQIDATIDVHKTVWWSDKSNATVRVSSSSSPETTGGGVPNVLFLGTLCSTHGLTASTIADSLNAITEVANVNYWLYKNNDAKYSGSLSVGETVSSSAFSVGSNAHFALLAFYERLYDELIVKGVKYDYIVFEFDGSRIGKYYTSSYSSESFPKYDNELEVANALKTFYAEDRVIWIVDDATESGQSEKFSDYWRPNTYYYSAGSGTLTATQYQGLIGLFDPAHYSTTASYDALMVTSTKSGSTTYYANDRNDLQAQYNDPSEVVSMLRSTIKVKPYNLFYRDKIVNPAAGLTIRDVTIEACTNGVDGVASSEENDWKSILDWDMQTSEVVKHDAQMKAFGINGASMTVESSTNLVTVVLSNITSQVWLRYDTHVVDDGTFCTSEGANYNQSTGQYEKNPNDGGAYLALLDDLGTAVGVAGEAQTSIPWRYTAYQISGSVQNGDLYVGGTTYKTLSFSEGRSVTVYYRGRGGYKIAELIVDGESMPLTGENLSSYTFTNLQADHTIHVEYVAYYGSSDSEPASAVYDGLAHCFPVTLDDNWDPDFTTQVRYSYTDSDLDEEYVTAADFPTVFGKDGLGAAAELYTVGEHEIYYRVYALQPGYGATFDQSGWVWVDTGMSGHETVTITPRPLVITAKSFKLSAEEAPNPGPLDQWRGVLVEGIVAGDTVNTNGTLTWSCPEYQYACGQYPLYPVYVSGKSAADIASENYEVELRPGVLSVIKSAMVIGGVHQFSGLDPEDPLFDTGVAKVEKPYDGEATNLVIRIDSVEQPGGFRRKYRVGDSGAWTETMPTFYHVGTNKVWYVVESGADYDDSIYFYVTNYNYVIITPRTLTVSSAGAVKQYDGAPLTNDDWEVVSGDLAPGDELDATATGSQTDVGSSLNVLGVVTIVNGADDRTGDYEIMQQNGTLTVTPAYIRIDGKEHDPDNPRDYDDTGIEAVEKTYDGLPTNLVVNVTYPATGCTILYSTDLGQTWQAENPTFTDAGSHTVYVKLSAPNFAEVTTFSRVKINPRPLTVNVFPAQMKCGTTVLPEFSAVVTDDETGKTVSDSVAAQLEYTIAVSCQHAATAPEELPAMDHTIAATGEAVQGNYSLTLEGNVLTVSELEPIFYTVSDDVHVYDGLGHGLLVTVTNGVPNVTVKYAVGSDGPWYDTLLSVTNVADSGTLVYFRIESSASGYATVLGAAPVTILPWEFPAGPEHQLVDVPEEWIRELGGFTGAVDYQTASNYVYGVGENGITNWMNYVLGLDPHSISSVVYLDIEPNLLCVTNPTLITCGAKVRPMPIGGLTNVAFRLMRSDSPTGTYEKVEDTYDGVFPQTGVSVQYFRIDTRFLFEQK